LRGILFECDDTIADQMRCGLKACNQEISTIATSSSSLSE
jgi:hypothetical protein